MCVSFYIASCTILGTKNRRKKLGLTYEAGHKKGDYFGKGYATRLCVDLAAASSGMDNAAHCTAHGRRKSMISSLVNSSVALPTKIILDKSRHGSAEINARYLTSCHQRKCNIKQGLQFLRSLKMPRTSLKLPKYILPTLHLFLLR